MALALIAAMHSQFASAGTLIVEAGPGLAVPVSAVLQLAGSSPKIAKSLSGKTLIETKMEFPDYDNSPQNTVIAAIPGLSEQPAIDYVLRQGSPECVIVQVKKDGQWDWDRLRRFDCPSDTLSIVRERAECSATGGTWDTSNNSGKSTCVPDNRASCSARGGVMKRICMAQTITCVAPYKDAGKPCSDGSQCAGHACLDVGNKPGDDGVLFGQCKGNDDPCGSFNRIANGKKRGRMHVD